MSGMPGATGIEARLDEERALREAERLETPRFSLPEGHARQLVAVVAVCFSVFQLYTAAFGAFEQYIQRSIHLAFGVALIALTYRVRARGGIAPRRPAFLDWAFLAIGLFASLWLVFNHERLTLRVFQGP